MSLNIKNERVHALAREAAAVTGRSQTGAIELALERLLEEHRAEQRKLGKQKRIDDLIAWLDANVTDEDRAAVRQTMAEMYDDDGLPR